MPAERQVDESAKRRTSPPHRADSPVFVPPDATRQENGDDARLLEFIFSGAGICICVTDAAGAFVRTNPAFASLFGYTPEDLAGRDFTLFFPPARQQEMRATYARIVAGGDPELIGAARMLHRDGSTRRVNLTARRFVASTGQPFVVASVVDVTEQRAAEEAVAESERVLGLVFELSNAGLTLLDDEGLIVRVNPAWCAIFGWTPDETIGKHFSFVVADGLGRRAANDVRRVFEHGEAFTPEVTLRHRSGAPLTVLMNARPFTSGERKFVVCTMIDVTEQRRIEARLRDSEMRYRQFIEAAHDGIWVADAADVTTFVNPPLAEMLGYTVTEMVGRPVRDFFDDAEWAAGAWRHAGRHDGEKVRYDFRLRRRDGRELWVLISSSPLTDAAGKFSGTLVSLTDITERKRQDAAVARLAAIVDSSDDAILDHDLQGRVTSWNSGAERIFGYTAAEAVGRFTDFIVPPGVKDETAAGVETAASGKFVLAPQLPRITRDGRLIYLSCSIFPIRDEFGRVVGVAGIGRDVTALKKQGDDAARLAALVDSSPDAIVGFAPDGTITDWNAGAERLFGYTAEESLGQPVTFVSRPGDSAGEAEARRRVLAGEAIGTPEAPIEVVRITKDGREVIVSLMAFPVRDSGGAITGGAVICRDITAERVQRDALRRLAAIVEFSNDAIVGLDPEGRITSWNRGAEALYGYTAEEVIGTVSACFSDAASAADGEPGPREWLLAGQSFTGYETIREARGGEPIAISLSGFPLRDEGGEPVGFALVHRDIREPRRTEALRRQTEESLRTVLQNAPVILFACDLTGTITTIAGRGLDAAGIRAADLLGTSILDFGGDAPAMEAVNKAFNGEPALAITALHDSTLEVRYSPLFDGSGRVTGIIGVALDVTEQRRAEQALIQAQKLESLGVLAGGIAHDFNNLLVAVMGNADLALMALEPGSPNRVLVGEIKHAATRAADLAQQMLAYSGHGSFIITRFSLETVVEEMAELLRVSLRPGVALVYDFHAGGAEVEGDVTQVRQVIMNLVLNASEAITRETGEVRLATSIIHGTRELFAGAYLAPDLPEGAYVRLAVSDTGKGMDAATLARIFDPFFTTKFTGRGLGLAAVLGIIRGHRGAVLVDSARGRGTTFTVVLPIVQP
ncbi:MAG: PAS domain S-box protein [Chloroflexi bacterium]|nr:PAS domain S-box protein [Chloroflexota bacterium]